MREYYINNNKVGLCTDAHYNAFMMNRRNLLQRYDIIFTYSRVFPRNKPGKFTVVYRQNSYPNVKNAEEHIIKAISAELRERVYEDTISDKVW